jgi:nitroreductase
MEAMEAILTRRSIRKYTTRPVAEQLIKHLLEAAMCAPSARNQQSWQFLVIRERAKLDRLHEVHPNVPSAGAPLAILVCGDLSVEASPGFWVQDCSAAVENLLLAAHASGLGAVWSGVYPREERVAAVRALFELPEHIMPLAVLAIGYPAEEKGRQERYDSKKVHFDRW